MKMFCRTIACFLIWALLCVHYSFAEQDSLDFNKEYLSPRLTLSNESLKEMMRDIFSRMKIDAALKKTAADINEIGRRNFKRELSPREMVMALTMIAGGKTLREIDAHFDNLNYVLEEFGMKKKPKQILRMRIWRTVSTAFMFLSLGAGFVLMDIVRERYFLNILITAPVFLFIACFFVGRVIDFIFWVEQRLDPKNKHGFSHMAENLNADEKEQYLFEIEQTIRNVVNDKFDPYDKSRGREDKSPQEESQQSRLPLTIDEKGSADFIYPLKIGMPGLLLSSI